MRVIFPYTVRRKRVLDALGVACDDAWLFNVSWHDSDYFYLLAHMWDVGESFTVVEHDVICTPWAIQDLEKCAQPWCAWQVRYGDSHHAGLGCAKFSAEIISAVPDAMELVGKRSDDQHPPMHWCRIDWWLQQIILPEKGFTQHVHGAPLDHLREHPYDIRSSHGCNEPGKVTGRRASRQCVGG